jgi:acetone carboxylase gamma subunit
LLFISDFGNLAFPSCDCGAKFTALQEENRKLNASLGQILEIVTELKVRGIFKMCSAVF